MTTLAGHASFPVDLSDLGVRVRSETFRNFFVAGRTGFLANKVARGRSRLARF